MQLQSDYFTAYHNLKLTRDDKGVVVAEFHSNGGLFIMSAQAHTELVDACCQNSQNKSWQAILHVQRWATRIRFLCRRG